MEHIADRRQFFWHDALLDPAATDARLTLGPRPVRREQVLAFDRPWEKDSAGYIQIFRDGPLYRMYYVAQVRRDDALDEYAWNHPDRRVCYAQSSDGIHWEKPALYLRSFEGDFATNILFDNTDIHDLDNFFVCLDTNPACPPQARYKAIAYTTQGPMTPRRSGVASNRMLLCWFSGDGIHFTQRHVLPVEGRFDTHNTLYFNPDDGLYHLFFRDIHVLADGTAVRDVYHATSADFVTWQQGEPLRYGDGNADLQMYTNGVQPYHRGPGLLLGLPTRYLERPAWDHNFDHLPARQPRTTLMAHTEPRAGLAMTDCGFMCSRNGADWYRFGEAFLTPGPENGHNWFYGDCYPALTRPFTFTGDALEMNFSTSALGQVHLALCAEDGTPLPGYETTLFGDAVDRPVAFPAPLGALQGRPVRLALQLWDAQVYSFRFFAAKT